MRLFPLREAADFINGRAFKPEEWGIKGLPIIRIQNLTNSSDVVNYYDGPFDEKHLVKRGDILISWSASLGVYVWDREDALLNQHIFKVVPKPSIDRTYFYYAASNILSELIAQIHGSTMQHITKDPFESTLIPIPEAPVQHKIANILMKADRIRQMQHYSLELTETYLQSVFLEIFGDPGKNPKRWPIAALGSKIKFMTSGSRGWAEYYSDKGDIFLRIQNIGQNRLLLEDVAFVQVPDSTESIRTCVKPGDLVISITADLGRTAVIPRDFPKAFINQHLALLRIENLNSVFVAACLITPFCQRQIANLNREGVKSGLNFDDIRGLNIIVPPIILQEQFAQIVQKYEHLQNQQHETARQVEHLYQTLLHKTFNEKFNGGII